ncbi:MAG: hypothetical protein CVU55_04115 [Deltaproteobacteria bacterium HGW-Deltaproteobacteria-13]|jgi:hypothetical protein|nr:MAG: hypothetical protein CVU55_04115 [Deltaproteobacteria bacterium HGW-Deltaproteobacteria-13]
MEKSHKIKTIRLLFYFFLIFIGLIFPFPSFAETPQLNTKYLENEIMKTLGKNIKCKKIIVQIMTSKEKPNEIKTLAVKFESVMVGDMAADYMTVLYEKPVIDVNQLTKAKKFKILSSSSNKVGILISVKAIDNYIAAKAKQLLKKQVRVSVRFSPPYAECFFDIPVSAIPPKTLKILAKYVKGKNLEGYAAIQMSAKNNALSALSSKAIVNHFLIPGAVRQELLNTLNPFDRVPVLFPLRYSINHVNVQNNYLFLSN